MAVCIALEGPDGVGKSTAAVALKELFQSRTAASSYSDVRIRHFPTDMLTACAGDSPHCLKAEDYAKDMENWLALRAEPGTLYILDRWALSAAVYASLRGEPISGDTALTLDRLNRVPLTTFVLMPREPAALEDPDFPGPDPYDPVPVAEAYRRFLTNAFVAGEMSRFIPIAVDRAVDTPESVAAKIAGHEGLQKGGVTRIAHGALDAPADLT